jgi:hypothetical protein
MLALFGESMVTHGLRADKYLALHVLHNATCLGLTLESGWRSSQMSLGR